MPETGGKSSAIRFPERNPEFLFIKLSEGKSCFADIVEIN